MIEAYHAPEDGIVLVRSGQGAERAALGRSAVAAGVQPRDGGWLRFPGYGRFSRILAVGNSRFRAPAMHGFGCSKQLIQQRYSQRDQAIFAPARIFLREFSRLNGTASAACRGRPRIALCLGHGAPRVLSTPRGAHDTCRPLATASSAPSNGHVKKSID
jgi:hypothetical protein